MVFAITTKVKKSLHISKSSATKNQSERQPEVRPVRQSKFGRGSLGTRSKPRGGRLLPELHRKDATTMLQHCEEPDFFPLTGSFGAAAGGPTGPARTGGGAHITAASRRRCPHHSRHIEAAISRNWRGLASLCRL